MDVGKVDDGAFSLGLRRILVSVYIHYLGGGLEKPRLYAIGTMPRFLRGLRANLETEEMLVTALSRLRDSLAFNQVFCR